MKRVNVFLDGLDVTTIAAILALLGLGAGVAWVFGPGWGLIVVCLLVLLYVILPDQRSAT